MIVSPIRAPIRTPIAAAMRQRRGSVLGALGSALEAAGYTGSYWYPGGYSGATLAGGLAWGTMFQDSTGATPVTALEQSVGFRTDRRYLENPTIGANVVSGVTATYTGSSAAAGSAHRIYSPAGAASAVEFASTLTVGQFYVVTFTIDSITTAGGGLLIGTAGATILASGAVTVTRGFVATATTASIGRVSGVTDIQISSISFQAVTLPATVYGSANLVTNGDFPTNTTGWASGASLTSTATATGGVIQITLTANFGRQVQSLATVVGRTYEASVICRKVSGNYAYLAIGLNSENDTVISTTNTTTTFAKRSVIFTATTTNTRLQLSGANNGDVVEFDNVTVRELKGTHLLQATSTARGTVSAAYTLLANASANTSLPTQNVTTLATTYRLYFTGGGTVTLSGTATGAYTAGTHTITCTAGTLTLTVSGSVLTPAFWLAAYNSLSLPLWQRRGVTTATVWDYDCTGTMADGSTGTFPCYIRAQTDDSYSTTRTMDFTGTDQIYVSAGLVKQSDATTGIVIEHGTTGSVGTYALFAPRTTATGDVGFRSTGTILSDATQGSLSSPVALAISCYGSISGDISSITVQNTTTTSSTNQGTGNYGDYTGYLYSRSGGTLPSNLNGYYELAVDGRATTAASRAALTSQLARDLMKLSY